VLVLGVSKNIIAMKISKLSGDEGDDEKGEKIFFIF
jgi:hypothetical protein